MVHYQDLVLTNWTKTPTIGNTSFSVSSGSTGLHDFSKTIQLPSNTKIAYVSKIIGNDTYQDYQSIDNFTSSFNESTAKLTLTGQIYSHTNVSHSRQYSVEYTYYWWNSLI